MVLCFYDPDVIVTLKHKYAINNHKNLDVDTFTYPGYENVNRCFETYIFNLVFLNLKTMVFHKKNSKVSVYNLDPSFFKNLITSASVSMYPKYIKIYYVQITKISLNSNFHF